MFEKASDLAEYQLYTHWDKLRKELPEKDFKLVDQLLDSLINFAETYPEHDNNNKEPCITISLLKDIRDLD
tara:strand:- start:1109 stop:1321 length:213 start_codon:yes stop_codon:yes gene_type:complete